jgi:carnitine 3-dehydrogenase
MGTFLTYRIAGGEEGMHHFLEQFGPALEWPWTKLTDVPELTPALIDKIASQSDTQAGGLSIRELERLRDDNLVALLQALRARRYGAGAVQHEHEARLLEAAAPSMTGDPSRPLRLFDGIVDPSWVDYNGHLTESRYLHVFAEATDALLGLVGVDADYLGRGLSAYTVETHIRHLREVGGQEPIVVETQILATDEKRLHVFHTMTHARSGETLATGEHMLLHVDAGMGRAGAWEEPVAGRLAAAAAAHAHLPTPEGAGRAVGVPP